MPAHNIYWKTNLLTKVSAVDPFQTHNKLMTYKPLQDDDIKNHMVDFDVFELQ